MRKESNDGGKYKKKKTQKAVTKRETKFFRK